MDDSYAALRGAIYSSEDEMKRFRQLVVNSVMATDVMDKELGQQRKDRWAKAFSVSPSLHGASAPSRELRNRRATIIMEHIIQASDVSHTMQHWHVYRQWNEVRFCIATFLCFAHWSWKQRLIYSGFVCILQRLFREMRQAYLDGRSEKDPAEFWYEGEIGFFDFYVIPLARKLKDCGVFGVSSAELLQYAQQNRQVK